MYKYLILTLTILLSSCNYQIDSNYYIMIYGIEDYSSYQYITEQPTSNLSGTVNDAQTVAKAFENIPNSTIFERYKSTTQSENSSTELEPSKVQFYSDIDTINEKITKDDYFIFFYAGHGMGEDTFSNFEDYNEEENISQTVNSSNEFICLSYYTGAEEYSDILMSDNEMKVAMQSINSDKKVLIFDSCNSGGFTGDFAELDSYDKNINLNFIKGAYLNYKNFTTNSDDMGYGDGFMISAAAEEGYSYETVLDGTSHGIFTYFFVKSLKEGDRNRDNLISLDEIFYYVLTEIDDNNIYQKIGLEESFATINGDQVPGISGGPIDLVLCNKLNFDDSIF